MITSKYLNDLHTIRLTNARFGSVPKRMFVDGIFNESNWNGGDGVIRKFLYSVYDEEVPNAYDIEFGSEEDYWSEILICHVDKIEEQSYATILYKQNVYYFEWYKNRGCTEVARFNGIAMKEDEYITLLNAIESTGYKLK